MRSVEGAAVEKELKEYCEFIKKTSIKWLPGKKQP